MIGNGVFHPCGDVFFFTHDYEDEMELLWVVDATKGEKRMLSQYSGCTDPQSHGIHALGFGEGFVVAVGQPKNELYFHDYPSCVKTRTMKLAFYDELNQKLFDMIPPSSKRLVDVSGNDGEKIAQWLSNFDLKRFTQRLINNMNVAFGNNFAGCDTIDCTVLDEDHIILTDDRQRKLFILDFRTKKLLQTVILDHGNSKLVSFECVNIFNDGCYVVLVASFVNDYCDEKFSKIIHLECDHGTLRRPNYLNKRSLDDPQGPSTKRSKILSTNHQKF